MHFTSHSGQVSLALDNNRRCWFWSSILDRFVGWIAESPERTILLLCAWAWGLATIQLLTLFLSLSTAIGVTPASALATFFVAIISGTIFYEWPNKHRSHPYTARSKLQSHNPEKYLGRIIVAISFFFLLNTVFFSYHNPDTSWDGLSYHLPPIHFWALDNRVGWIDAYPEYSIAALKSSALRGGRQDVFMNGYPKAAELLSFVLVRSFHDDRLLNMVNFLFYPFSILGITAISRKLGASPYFAAASGLLFVFIPVVVANSVTTYVDVSFSATLIGLMAVSCHIWMCAIRGRLTTWPILGMSALAGLALGTKYTALAPVALLLGIVSIAMIVGVVRCSRKRSELIAHYMLMSVILLVGITATGGYWYIRNYVIAHNPLFPMKLSIRNWMLFDGIDPTELVTGLPNTHTGRLTKMWNTWLQGGNAWPQTILKYDSQTGGLGFLWPYGCVPAVALCAIRTAVASLMAKSRRSSERQMALVFMPLLLVILITMALIPGYHIPRYTLFIYGLGLPALAANLTILAGSGQQNCIVSKSWGMLRYLGLAVFAYLGFITVNEGRLVYQHNVERYRIQMQMLKNQFGIHKSDWLPYDIAVSADGRFRSFDLMKEIMLSSAPVAFGAFPNHLQGLLVPGILSHPIGGRPIHFIDSAVIQSPKGFKDFVTERKIKFIILDAQANVQLPSHVLELVRAGQGSKEYKLLALK